MFHGLMRRVVASALIVMLAALSAGAAPTLAAGPTPPGECPQLKPLSQVSVGATGYGWTVDRGTTPKRFGFEVLGIIADGIAPGRDLVIVDVSDVDGNDMISHAGGIWAGMSGSPVYLGNKLLGSVSYGFTAGPSTIGGVTPAVDMADILGYGASPATAPARVNIPKDMRASLASRAGVSESQAQSLAPLAVPFAVSGLNLRGRSELDKRLAARGLSAIVFSASGASRSAAVTISDRPVPGGNFAGVVSYGDVTMAGIGTTTYVCHNKALAFGHPLTYGGAVAFGANDANAIAVVDDPTFTPFKMASITGLFGKLDQDRLTGIRAKLNGTPVLRPITSHVTNVDTGQSRNGRSDATMNEWVPTVAAFHLLANADVIFDQLGAGSSQVSWTINGVRANGQPWHLNYSNLYASPFDISFESIFQMGNQLAYIQDNPFEAVRFTSVDINAAFDDTFRQYAIESVKISKNGGPFRDKSFVTVSPGDNLTARVSLRRYRGNLVSVDLNVTVPNDAEAGSFGSLSIGAGAASDSGPVASNFSQLLAALQATPRNNELVASLSFSSFDGESTGGGDSDSDSMDAVVVGSFEIGVDVQ
jgi:hypothetical protein